MNQFYDVVIIGAGVAGLSALAALDRGQRVALISPGGPTETGSTWRAQGGVAVALGEDDSPALHEEDTLQCARGLALPQAVRVLTEEGCDRVAELLTQGLEVDLDSNGHTLFGLEAAHSRARVVHRRDHTGRALIAHLWQRAQARPHTRFLLDRVVRILVGDGGVSGVVLGSEQALYAPRVILASGGFAGLYQATTTGREVRGEGIVLAQEVGAEIADMEFVQFHPTALAVATDGPLPLLTEALRGAGAKLRTESGERFVEELLPRDEVARAIAEKRAEGRTVYLDLSPVERLSERFPGAHAHVRECGRLNRLWLPVRPAAHYTIGGVKTGLHGQTSVAGLYACGEVASVGVHGANRLASNSLLEGLVFGHRAGQHAAATLRVFQVVEPVPGLVASESGEEQAELRARFEAACGVVRTGSGLTRFLDWLALRPVTMETRLAAMVGHAALARQESLGGHYRLDSVDEQRRVAG